MEIGDDKEREMMQRLEEGIGFVVMKVGGNDIRIIKVEKIGFVLIQINDVSELFDCQFFQNVVLKSYNLLLIRLI